MQTRCKRKIKNRFLEPLCAEEANNNILICSGVLPIRFECTCNKTQTHVPYCVLSAGKSSHCKIWSDLLPYCFSSFLIPVRLLESKPLWNDGFSFQNSPCYSLNAQLSCVSAALLENIRSLQVLDYNQYFLY